MSDKLSRLRDELNQIRDHLVEAEADLADRLAEINAFEFEFEARVGYLIDQLDTLEREIARYNERIQMTRHRDSLGNAYLPVEAQYRRTWQIPSDTAPIPPPQPLAPPDEAEIKRLYRQLARRFHPDLADTEEERVYRTQKMVAINDAYAARSLVELIAIADRVGNLIETQPRQQTETQMIAALQAELKRCQRRLQEIERELRQLPQRPSVALSLEVKAALARGRDLLGDIAGDYERKIARKTVERDMLKAQFDQLGPDQGFIRIER